MADVLEVDLVNGVPTGGTGKAKTLNSVMADGGLTTIGLKADAAASDSSSSWSVISLLKGLYALLTGNLTVNLAAKSSGGATPFTSYVSAGSLDAASIQAQGCTLHSMLITSTDTVINYVHVYNFADAPTVGSTTRKWVIPVPVPATGSVDGIAVPLPAVGVNFSIGFAIAITTSIDQTGNAAAGKVVISGSLK